MKKFNLSKAAYIQPETLLKNKLFHHRFFARFLFGTLFSGSFRAKQPKQPSVVMKPGKYFEPVSLARPLSVATLLLWKLKGRCRVKWLWVESHFTTRLFRYAWRNNLSLIYGMAISLLFIWVNLKISIIVIQEPCFANFLLKKSYFSARSAHVENTCVV